MHPLSNSQNWILKFLPISKGKVEYDYGVENLKKFVFRTLKSKYSNTIEELFSRHLERMIMKRHVVPKYKVRYSPFFSDRYFKFNTNDAIPLQLSCNLVWFLLLRNSSITYLYLSPLRNSYSEYTM